MHSEEIRELLRSRLEMEAQEEGFSPLKRVVWLVTRLEDYIARFNGALVIPGWSMEDLRGSDTLRVIEVGAELLDHEIRSAVVPTDIAAAWEEVRICLTELLNSAEMSRRKRSLTSIFQRRIGKGGLDRRNAQKLWDATRELCTTLKAAC